MKKIPGLTFSIVIMITFTRPIYAQWVQTNGPFGGSINTLAAIPNTQTGGNDIFAGTEGGGVFLSTDNGMHWQSVNEGLKNHSIRGLTTCSKSGDGSILYAGTHGGLYCTTNRGTTWNSLGASLENQDVTAAAAYFDTAFDTVLLANTNVSLLASTDAGRHWVSSNLPPHYGNTCFAVAPATKDSGIIYVFAGTQSNGIYISSDNGMTWSPSTNEGLPNLNIESIGICDSVIYAGVYTSGVYRSTDNGTSWIPANNGLPSTDIHAFAFAPNSDGSSSIFALNEPNDIFLSTDSGDHWQSIKHNLWANMFFSIAVTPLNTDTCAIFAGTSSGVFRSTNTGLNWEITNQGLSACIVSALGVSQNSIYAGTLGNGIFRSEDNGSEWTAVNNGLDTIFIESISSFGGLSIASIASFGNTLLVGTHAAGIFRSTDEGLNWNDVNNEWTRRQIWSFAKSDSAIFAGADYFDIFRSTDDGITWNSGDTNSTSFSPGSVIGMIYANSELVAAAAERGLFRSTDNGVTWNRIFYRQANDPIAIAYFTPYLILGTGTGSIYRSSNDGEIWEDCSIDLTDYYGVNSFVVSGSNIFAGTDNGIFLSTDYGSHWSSVSSEELNTPIRSLAAAGSDLIAGTQGAGVVWKRPLSEMITPASVSKEAFVFGYKLEQNYPNPFNPSTVIRYQLPENTLVILKVYDILGKEVVTLVDQLQNAGSHSVTFNTLNLPIGVYFYRLEAGRYHNTRKLLLLK